MLRWGRPGFDMVRYWTRQHGRRWP